MRLLAPLIIIALYCLANVWLFYRGPAASAIVEPTISVVAFIGAAAMTGWAIYPSVIHLGFPNAQILIAGAIVISVLFAAGGRFATLQYLLGQMDAQLTSSGTEMKKIESPDGSITYSFIEKKGTK